MGLKKLETLAKSEYGRMNGHSHDWSHITRVRNNAVQISMVEGGAKAVIVPAAILHDLGRSNHKEKGHSLATKLAQKILKKSGYSKSESRKIIECVKTHSYKDTPTTIEAKILFDADKIDSYGYIGIARFFSLAGEKKWPLKQAIENAIGRINALKAISGFHTKTGRKLGLKKAKRTLKFYQELTKEMGVRVNF